MLCSARSNTEKLEQSEVIAFARAHLSRTDRIDLPPPPSPEVAYRCLLSHLGELDSTSWFGPVVNNGDLPFERRVYGVNTTYGMIFVERVRGRTSGNERFALRAWGLDESVVRTSDYQCLLKGLFYTIDNGKNNVRRI